MPQLAVPAEETKAPMNVALPRALVEKRLPHEFAIEIDSDGSPVSVSAADWFVCFVPGLQRQWWHSFVNARYQHVFAMRMVDEDTWIIVEPWWTRMLVTVLTLDEAVKFLRWGATGNILQVREAIPGNGNQVRGWANCAVLTAFLLGRSYRTWTPFGLYRRLVKDPGARPVDLAHWLADHVRHVAARNADRALESVHLIEGRSVRAALLQLGTSIMGALMSRSSVALYKLAVSESSRFGAAANAYWEEAPKRAIDAVLEVLQQAQLRGEIQIDNASAAARHFVAMLRGDLHLEILFGLRQCPGATETHIRVKSAVDLLLYGATAAASLPISAKSISPASSACDVS